MQPSISLVGLSACARSVPSVAADGIANCAIPQGVSLLGGMAPSSEEPQRGLAESTPTLSIPPNATARNTPLRRFRPNLWKEGDQSIRTGHDPTQSHAVRYLK